MDEQYGLLLCGAAFCEDAVRRLGRLSLFLAAVSLAPSALGATVISTADDGPGSLREAIANATPGETITFAVSGLITLTSGQLVIDKDLTIVGPGASLLAIQRSTNSGTPDFRIFNIQSGKVGLWGLAVGNGRGDTGGGLRNAATLTLRDCLIQHNTATGPGGGIFNSGNLSMSGCLVLANSTMYDDSAGFHGYGGGVYNSGTLAGTNCGISSNSVVAVGAWSAADGGGIWNAGTLLLTNSMVAGNAAIRGPSYASFGGGIYAGGTTVLDGCAVASNSADNGAGIINGFGWLVLVRSTVSSNVGAPAVQNWYFALIENSTISGNQGGGVGNGVWTTLRNSTITANIGVGVHNSFDLDVKNCIIAANIAGTDLEGDFFQGCFEICPGTIRSQGFNVVGSTNGYVLHPGPNDQYEVSPEALRLGPLQDNGGPTFTHALLAGSVAVDAGDETDAPATDQRGFPRIMGRTIDVGAYEAGEQPGAVWFGNDSSTLVTNQCTGEPAFIGDYFLAELYYAPDGPTNTAALVPLGDPVFLGPQDGRFYGGVRATPTTTPPGQFALFQVRIWEAAFGSTYEGAVAAPPQHGHAALTGLSPILRVATGLPGSPPTLLVPNGLGNIVVGGPGCVAPGSVLFENGPLAPVTNLCTGERLLAGTNFLAGLYYAPLGETDESRFVQLGEATSFGPSSGLFYGGARATPATTAPGQSASFQIRVWEAAYGATYEGALAAPPRNGRGALAGKSEIFQAPSSAGGVPAPPFAAYGLRSFFVGFPECVASASVLFQNSLSSLVTNLHTGQPVIVGTAFLAALYCAPDGVTDESLFSQLGEPVGIGPEPGRFQGYNRVATACAPPGQPAMFQVRVWESAYGASYEQALSAPPQEGRLAILGKSGPVRVPTLEEGLPLRTPPTLSAYGLKGFFVAQPGWLDPGTVLFQNSPDSLVTNRCTHEPLPSGSDYLAALYYAPDGTTNDFEFVQLGAAAEFGPEPGRIHGGPRAAPPSTPPGNAALFQYRVWEAAYGASYEEAISAPPRNGLRAQTGRSSVVRVTTLSQGYPTAPPAAVIVPGFAVDHPFSRIQFSDDGQPIYDICTTHPVIPGTTYLAALYFGPEGAGDDTTFIPIALSSIGPQFGQVHWGTLDLPTFVNPGQPARFQLRGWESAFGATYEEAMSAPPQFGRQAFVGKSKTFLIYPQSVCGLAAVAPRFDAASSQVVVGQVCTDERVQFAHGADYVPSIAWSIAVGDLDGDGRPDLLIRSLQELHFWKGRGDGSFTQDVKVFTLEGTHQALALGDFDRDGKLDLATLDLSPPAVRLFRGNGDGTFGPASTYSLGAEGNWILAADLNGDGKPDVLISSYQDQSLTVFAGNGDGTLASPKRIALGFSPTSLAAADFTGDCLTDIVVGSPDGRSLVFLWNVGNFDFVLGTTQQLAVAVTALAAADINGDHQPDIVAVNAPINWGSSVTVMLSDRSATLTPVVTYGIANIGIFWENPPPFIDTVVAADLNGDGKPDIVALSANSQRALTTWLNETDAPQLRDDAAQTDENTPTLIDVLANDGRVGASLTISAVSQPLHGTAAIIGGTNILYRPATNFFGSDTFTYAVGGCRGQGVSVATVTVTVRHVNQPPVAVAQANSPTLFTGLQASNVVVIAGNNADALVILDASGSSDPDNDPMQFSWFEGESLEAFASGTPVNNTLGVGTHTIILVASDGQSVGRDSLTVEVVTPCEAVQFIQTVVVNSGATARIAKSLLASLDAACASFDRYQMVAGVNQLEATAHKLRAQVARADPQLADALEQLVQQVINAVRMAPRR